MHHLYCNYETTKQSERTSNPSAATRHTKKRAVWNRRIIRRHGERTLAPRPQSNQLIPFIISHKDQAVLVQTVLGAILHQRLRVLEQNLVTAGYLLSLMTSVHTQKVFSKVQVRNVTTSDPWKTLKGLKIKILGWEKFYCFASHWECHLIFTKVWLCVLCKSPSEDLLMKKNF